MVWLEIAWWFYFITSHTFDNEKLSSQMIIILVNMWRNHLCCFHRKLREQESEFAHIHLEDLTVIKTLGVGGFGRVELVYFTCQLLEWPLTTDLKIRLFFPGEINQRQKDVRIKTTEKASHCGNTTTRPHHVGEKDHVWSTISVYSKVGSPFVLWRGKCKIQDFRIRDFFMVTGSQKRTMLHMINYEFHEDSTRLC